MTGQVDKPTRIRGLDGVRGISAWAVVGIHFGMLGHLPGWLARLVDPVTVFFVLSGFLITSILLDEREVRGTISLSRFWRNRSLRIFPVYFAFVAAVAVTQRFDWFAPSTSQHLQYTATYRSNFLPERYYSGHLGAMWSLSIEEHFYVVWPLVIAAAWRWRLHAGAVGLGLCVLVRLWLYANPQLFAAYRPLRFTVPGSDAILVGCLLAFWRHRVVVQNSLWGAYVLLAVATFTVANPVGQAVVHYAYICGVAVVLSWIVSNQRSVVITLLEFAPLRFFGTISYGIYVWQGFWISTGPSDQRHWVQQFPQGVVVIGVTAIASWYMLEAPFLRLKLPRSAIGAPGRGVVSGLEPPTS